MLHKFIWCVVLLAITGETAYFFSYWAKVFALGTCFARFLVGAKNCFECALFLFAAR